MVRSVTGIVLMIIGLGFVLSGTNPELWGSTSLRWAVLAAGFSFWIIGSLAIFFLAGRGGGTYWLGGIMIIVGLFFFVAASQVRAALSPAMVPIVEIQRGVLFSFAVMSILFGSFYMLMASALPPAGESFPQGSPQPIPPPMPVKEPRVEEQSPAAEAAEEGSAEPHK